jgi:hypothetical protein
MERLCRYSLPFVPLLSLFGFCTAVGTKSGSVGKDVVCSRLKKENKPFHRDSSLVQGHDDAGSIIYI